MKKIITYIGVLLLATTMAFAQSPSNRSAKTIVVDILAQSPFDKQADYDKAMQELISTKEAGVLELVGMMKNPADGDNNKIEYALSGLTYSTAKVDNANRLMVSNAYLKSLDTTKERETLAFVIRQLEIVAANEAVDKLATYLSSESLSAPAASALSHIGTPKAEEALLKALATTSSNQIKGDIVVALGFMGAKNAESQVLPLLNSGDAKLQQAVVQTLGKIGTAASMKDLAALAKKANYTLDHSSATSAYLSVIKRLIAKDAEKAAKALVSNAAKAQSLGAREAALIAQMDANPTIANKLAIVALKDNSSRFRMGALRAAANHNKDGVLYSEVLKVYPKAKDNVKTDIAGWIEEEAKCSDNREKLQSAVTPLIASLATDNLQLQKAVSKSLVQLENAKAIEPLVAMVVSTNAESVEIGKNALANMKGDIATPLVKSLSKSDDKSKIAILELLALRKSSKHLSEVIALTNTGSDAVKDVAFKTLKDIVEAKDINSMYTLLESSDAQYTPALQDAVISALHFMPKETQFKEISTKLSKTPSNKKYLYYTALAATEDSQALDLILSGFNSNNKTEKDAAFAALTSWNSINAAEPLILICKDPSASTYFDRAIKAYIKLASSPKLSGENRLIYLREAMAIAKTDAQKVEIMKHVRSTNTFQGLIFAGKYLDDKATQELACQAIMNIAINNKSFTGKEVEELLNKVLDRINNPDAAYHKEAIKKHLREVPMTDGFESIFNGVDLKGWKGLIQNPIARSKMSTAVLAREQVKADKMMNDSWYVENGNLIFKGTGDNICTDKKYGDFEMYVDWMLDPAGPEADAGIYLRGTPQVQIWDTSRTNVGAEVGSGGLYNNETHESKPLKVADNKLGMWNTFYIKMIGDRVTVSLNGELVVDNVILENYWDRKQPIFSLEQIELQAHGSKVSYRDIYVKELQHPEPFQLSAEEKKEGYEVLFDGTNMHKWQGNTSAYVLEDGCISLHPETRYGGNLYTKDQFANFVYRFEFQLTPGANNGVGIRTPLTGDAAYAGMEIQILDHDDPIYNSITPLQVHGSVYGVIGAKRAKLKPAGEWNYEEIVANGDNIKVTLNGEVILEGNLKEAMTNGAADGKEHPGVSNKSGHIAFLGHGNPIKFRNIRVKKLK